MAETEVRNRSRRRGFRDVYIAKVTKNDSTGYTTDTPVKIGRGISAKVNDKFTIEKTYSDDGTEEIISSYEGTEIDLEVNALAPQDRRDLFGQLYDNGFLLKAGNDEAPEIALGWRAKKRNGKYEFVWYYCGKFGEGVEDEYATQEDKVDPKTNSIKGNFYQREKEDAINSTKKQLYSIVVDEENLLESQTEPAAAIAKWFESVQEYQAHTQPSGS